MKKSLNPTLESLKNRLERYMTGIVGYFLGNGDGQDNFEAAVILSDISERLHFIRVSNLVPTEISEVVEN